MILAFTEDQNKIAIYNCGDSVGYGDNCPIFELLTNDLTPLVTESTKAITSSIYIH